MTTTAEAALRRRSAVRVPAAAGAVASVALVVAASRSPMPVGVRIGPSFGGLLTPSSGDGTPQAVVVLLALAVLIVVWWRILRAVRTGGATSGDVLRTAALWAAPIVVAPPLLSMDAYAYLAQGQMLLQGLDPYSAGPILLGDTAAAARVDPMWRAAPVPYGPLALVLLRAVAWLTQTAGGSLVVGVLLLRLVVAVGIAAALAGALALARPHRRTFLLALLLLNPVTLVHLLGGVHLDAVAAGLVTVSLVALVSRRHSTSWWLAVMATAVKVTVAPLAVFALLGLRRAGWSWRRLLLAAASGVALPIAVSALVVPRPWGFLTALSVPGAAPSWYAPAAVVTRGVSLAAEVLDLPLTTSALSVVGRAGALTVGGLIVLWLLRDATRRPERTATHAAAALLVASLSLPSLHAWYVAAGLFALAALSDRRWTVWLVALSSAICFTSLPPLYGVHVWTVVGAWVATLLLLGVRARRELTELSTAPTRMHLRTTSATAGGRWALLLTAGLVVPGMVGLVAPTAASGSEALDAGALPPSAVADEQVRLLRQLDQQYPGRLVATLVPQESVPPRYDVELVGPGARRCQLVVQRLAGPLAGFARVASPRTDRWRQASDAPTCPPPSQLPSARGAG